MLGKGLESLIPKKSSGTPADEPDGVQQPDDASERYDENSREERDGLGILGGLGHHHRPAQQEAPSAESLPHGHAPASFVPHAASLQAQQRPRKDIPALSGPIFHIEMERISVNPYQPRHVFDDAALEELASSIREFGILQPLVVTKLDEETATGVQSKYQLIAGHRRLLAARKAGLRTVPVVVRNALKRADALELAIVENIQREDLNIIETARAYARLSDEFGLTQREIAVRLGKSREAIANALRLLSLPTEIQEALSERKIQESHARLLMQITDIQKQKETLRRILEDNLSVRGMKKMLSSEKRQGEAHRDSAQTEDTQLRSLEKDLSEFLGAPVRVEVTQNGGKIIIHFYSPEEAVGIAQKIHPEDM